MVKNIRRLVPILVSAIFLSIWWIGSAHQTSPFFPPLAEIVRDVWSSWLAGANLVDHILPSLRRLLLGFGLAASIGVVLGFMVGLSGNFSRATDPLLQFMRALPPVALLPIAIVLLGMDDLMKIGLIAFGAVWPVLLNTVEGVRGVAPERIAMARVFSLSQWQIIYKIVFPSAMPRIFAGLRVSLSLSIVVMVISEMVASVNGIGYLTLHASRLFDVTTVWSGMFVLALLGIALNLIFVTVEKRLLFWSETAR